MGAVLVSFILAANTLPMVFDDRITLDAIQDARLAPQPPEQTAVLIAGDPDRPKLWYSPAAVHETSSRVFVWYQRVNKDEKEYTDQRTLCLGYVDDGQWHAPAVSATPAAWGEPNNVVMRRSPKEPTWGGFNVFQILFTHGHFRMLYWDQPEKGEAGAMLATSASGVEWVKTPGAVFTEHNDAFTCMEKDGEFLLYQTALEDWPDKPYPDNLPGKRRIQTLRTSADMTQWSPQQPFLRPDEQDAPETEFYLMKPFAYDKRYLALLMKYRADPAKPNAHSAILATEVLVSEDARAWRRPFRETDLGFWSYADPFTQGERWCFVYGKENRLEMAQYTPGRFFAVQPTGEGQGRFVTPPIKLSDADLAVDADTRQGWLDVEILDTASQPLMGFNACRVQGVDGRRIRLDWDGLGSSEIVVSECRLRITLNKARIFAVTTVE